MMAQQYQARQVYSWQRLLLPSGAAASRADTSQEDQKKHPWKPRIPTKHKRFNFKRDQREKEQQEADLGLVDDLDDLDDLGLFVDRESNPQGKGADGSSSSSSLLDAETKAKQAKGWLPFIPTATSDVVVWGKGRDGQLGLSRTKLRDSERPMILMSLSNRGVAHVACGANFTVVSTVAGVCYSWGNSNKALGHGGTLGQQPVPRRIEGLMDVNVRKIAAGDNFAAALTDTGKVFTWGENDRGQLGHSEFSAKTFPCPVSHLQPIPIRDIFCGPNYMFGLSATSPYAWGQAEEGQLGIDSHFSVENKPKQVTTLLNKKVKLIACGATHAAALCEDGVYKWGTIKFSSSVSVVQRVPEKDESIPEIISTDRKVVSLACGEAHVLVLVDDGDVFALGNNKVGQLGFSASEKWTSAAHRVALETACSGVFARYNYSGAISKSGEVFEWGARGATSKATHVAPIVVGGLSKIGVRSVSCGLGHSVALVSKLSQVGGDFSLLLASGALHDLLLISQDGKQYPAHAVVVASRSAKLSQLVAAVTERRDLSSPTPQELPLQVDSDAAMNLLLEFLYTDYVHSEGVAADVWRSLEKIANYYGVERLEAMCVALQRPALASSDLRRVHYAPPPSLEAHLHGLINNPTLADISFRVVDDGQETIVQAHRCILSSRSPYFKVMFDSGMSETRRGGCIEVSDTSSAVFVAILEYLYCSVVSLDPAYVVDLFAASHKYRISVLKQQCETFISENLDVENVVSLLQVSCTYDSPTLRSACRAYISEHFYDAVESPDCETLTEDVYNELWSLEPFEEEPVEPSGGNAYSRVMKETKAIFAGEYDDEEYVQPPYDSEDEQYLAPPRSNTYTF